MCESSISTYNSIFCEVNDVKIHILRNWMSIHSRTSLYDGLIAYFFVLFALGYVCYLYTSVVVCESSNTRTLAKSVMQVTMTLLVATPCGIVCHCLSLFNTPDY